MHECLEWRRGALLECHQNVLAIVTMGMSQMGQGQG